MRNNICYRLAFSLLILFGATMVRAEEAVQDRATMILVEGAAGEEDYARQFDAWAGRLAEGMKGKADIIRIGGKQAASELSDRDRLREQLTSKLSTGSAPVWLVLIGHGTFDGRDAKFNLRGPDVSAGELAEWCAPMKRPLAIIDCTSASGPFLNVLSRADRVIITATRNGHEQNFARFGEYFSKAAVDPSADLDKDGQTSLLEAYLLASRRVEEFYVQDARLATEHALLDDNGDGLGTPAAWFQGVRATREAKAGAKLDGASAHGWILAASDQERRLSAEARKRRDELEQAISKLRESKASLPEEQYYAQLEPLLVEIARLYASPPVEAVRQ
jgi:hypothetical protein